MKSKPTDILTDPDYKTAPLKIKRELKKAIKRLKVKPPGSSGEVLAQRQLERREALADELAAKRKEMADLRAEVGGALKAGARVSTGKRGVISGVRLRRHPAYGRWLKENNQELHDQIQEATPFKAEFWVRFITRNGKE
jgi:hypothetical protein